jgi:peptide/nickel transport system permease protein
LASVPSEEGAPPQVIGGTVPSPHAYPPGCRFAPRCALRVAACETAPPPYSEPAPGRRTRCLRWPEFVRAAQPMSAPVGAPAAVS